VSTNHLLFAGAGGTLTHNLAALTTGTGAIGSITFSNAPTGSYTISGNAMSILRGVTNHSTVSQTINNPLTLVSTQAFVANSGTLVIGGNVTNSGNQLRAIGNVMLNGIVSGAGGITKSGGGTMALTAINDYSGPTTNISGTITLNATSTFGNGSGQLVLAGGDILALNTRSGSPIANPLLLAGSSTISGNGTLTNSLRILPFSSGSITTAAGALTIRHTGTNALASNNVFRVRFTGGGFDFARPITLGFGGDLPSTSAQLESFNDDTTADQTFSGNISGTGQFRRDASNPAAAGRTILSGDNSYSGGTIVNAGTLLVNNLVGSGTGAGLVAVSNNGTLGGSGGIAGPVWCAGTISPGESAGTLTLGGGLDLSTGGTNVWELSTLTSSGEGTNFDQIILTAGNLGLGANAQLRLAFINSASAPNANDPFWRMSHTWKIISLAGPASNPGNTAFGRIVNGGFATGSFTNYADSQGNILLAYVATPAPPPLVQSFALDNAGDFSLSVTAQANRVCVLQYATDLSAPEWISTTTNIVPLDGLLGMTNSTGGDVMRFYRVFIVP
jgi:fibronectin-binding autotransporter adhesin